MSSFSAFVSSEREQYILDRLPQVRLVAARIHRRCPSNVLLEDLVSAGVTGLIEASNRFDPGRNLKFKTLAEHRIRGAILDYLRSIDPLPRAVRRFMRERETVLARFKTAPSEAEVAAAMDVSIDSYRSISQSARSGDLKQLDERAPVADSGFPTAYTVTLWREVSDALESLPECERAVILCLRAGQSPREISHHLNLTPFRISQIKQHALTKLRIILGVPPQSRLKLKPGKV